MPLIILDITDIGILNLVLRSLSNISGCLRLYLNTLNFNLLEYLEVGESWPILPGVLLCGNLPSLIHYCIFSE